MLDLKHKIKRYFSFSNEEIKSLVIVILLLGFIVGFNDGRATTGIDAYYGLNMLSSILVVALAVLVHLSVQRITGLQAGYKITFRIWWYGLAIGLVFAFITQGHFWLLLPGGIIATMLEKHRLGKFRYGLNYLPLGYIGLSGSAANILLAFFLRIISKIPLFASNVLLEKAILVNIAYAIYTYLPIPPLDGFPMLYASRLIYFFSAGALVGASFLIYFFKLNAIWILLGTLVIAFITWLLYYTKVESKI